MRKIAMLLAGLLATAPVLTARAEGETHRLRFSFDFYSGGAQLMTVDTQAVRQGEAYRGESTARSTGVFDFLMRLRSLNTVEGMIDGGVVMPRRFVTDADWRFSKRRVDITWNERREAISVADPPPEADDRDPVEPAQTVGALDPLSAALAQVLYTADKPCETRVPIFDGRRRYDLVMTLDGEDTFTPTDYTSFTGKALRCAIRVERIAGYARSAEEQNREMDQRKTMLWVARYPDQRLLVPVRLVADSFFGSVIGHLTFAEIDGQVRTPRKKG
ncbi:MAG: DUF3108 domain-containing protein [Alphaproteobacteria bacterium]|jgi:hypothetical protein|nr:DUF3108 domain-containing protein [Alphaproteobacteria bacterium]